MIRLLLYILLASSICISQGYAQQNFFNVPSSDITAPKKLFFQQQVNLYREGVQSNTTFSYGLGKNCEIGFNALGAIYEPRNKYLIHKNGKLYAPLMAVNFQKKFELSKLTAISIGSHLFVNSIGKTGMFIYINNAYYISKTKTKIVAGLYHTSDEYYGDESRNYIDNPDLKTMGFQAGIEQNIWKEKILFQSDFISGYHAMGQFVTGAAYCLNKNWVASAGYQIPAFNSHAIRAMVFEITYIPK